MFKFSALESLNLIEIVVIAATQLEVVSYQI